jgi:hypothetical protein
LRYIKNFVFSCLDEAVSSRKHFSKEDTNLIESFGSIKVLLSGIVVAIIIPYFPKLSINIPKFANYFPILHTSNNAKKYQIHVFTRFFK